MKGVIFPGDRRAEVREFPKPEPGPGEVVVKMKMVTHRFPIEEAAEAFQLFDTGRTGKVIFEWR
jgi:threonine dehydrogenase-like Zn-dependent dehydrogenase